jgi:hypothetical protein
MPSVALNFINNSNDTNPNGIVIFQQNVADSAGTLPEVPVAWLVFSNVGHGVAHPFQVPMDIAVAASDSFGAATPQSPASSGSRFDMVSSVSGNQLKLSSQAASKPQVVEVYNELPVGAINAMAYRNGLLLAQKTSIAPGQKVAFAFDPKIYIMLNSQIQQGDIIDATMLYNNETMISLLGISSADIVMTGGGSGADAQPVLFTLQNVVMA